MSLIPKLVSLPKRLKAWVRGAVPPRGDPPAAQRSVFTTLTDGELNQPLILAAETLGHTASGPDCIRKAMAILERLEPDNYLEQLLQYYTEGLKRFGENWRYADIVTSLCACADLLRPQSYLEIGVRRGRSMAVVGAICPDCHIVGFDLWVSDYAGMTNPGPDFVRSEMARLGHTGPLDLISGNSHDTLPGYFRKHPDAFFDLVTIDGDHSGWGAKQDLGDVLPRIKRGGIAVFDDICHPEHLYLQKVWRDVVESDHRFATWQFTDLGYGTAMALRKW